MKITILGAAGDVGHRIVQEALDRGHSVVAVTRSPASYHRIPRPAQPLALDVHDFEAIARNAQGSACLISAVRPPDGEEDQLVALTGSALRAAQRADIRALIVGGAARLKLPFLKGETVLTAPGFLPAVIRPIAEACQAQFEMVRNQAGVNWTYLSPPALMTPGRRTGRYGLGTDTLVVDPAGQSHLSMEDFAVAVLDEVENPAHSRRAFTVGCTSPPGEPATF